MAAFLQNLLGEQVDEVHRLPACEAEKVFHKVKVTPQCASLCQGALVLEQRKRIKNCREHKTLTLPLACNAIICNIKPFYIPPALPS